jgi:hypothetical protein
LRQPPRAYTSAWEHRNCDLRRAQDYLADFVAVRHANKQGQVSIYTQRVSVGAQNRGKQVVVQYDPEGQLWLLADTEGRLLMISARWTSRAIPSRSTATPIARCSSAPTAYLNGDLTASPPQAAIAPLWSDWIKLSGTPMLLGKFDDDHLILEWNDVKHFVSPNVQSPRGVTFQVVLTLNTGSDPGDIVFNYANLDTGDQSAEGATATVGIKTAGHQGANRLLVSFNGLSPFVQSGQALMLGLAAPGPTPRGTQVGIALGLAWPAEMCSGQQPWFARDPIDFSVSLDATRTTAPLAASPRPSGRDLLFAELVGERLDTLRHDSWNPLRRGLEDHSGDESPSPRPWQFENPTLLGFVAPFRG